MHLIVFHIGPVQDFIATARRSRDLWFGSWLLSELSKAAALEVARQNGDDVKRLIFPAPADRKELQSEKFNVANRVVAQVKQDPAELGKAVRKAILKRLHEIRDDAYEQKRIKGEFDRVVAERQVDDLPEFFWASCCVDGGYTKARTQAEALLAARKVTRDFAPVTWGNSVPKCSLDGCRESVIPERVYSQMTAEQLRKNYDIRSGERLCGVGLLKRHGRRGQDERFFSTSHIAALPLLERLTEQYRNAVDEYIGDLKRLGIRWDALNSAPTPHPVFGHNDGHLLFEERLREFFGAGDELKQAQKALHSFLNNAFGGERPLPYYALLCADGDRMGKAISEQKTPEQHQALSKKLAHFAGRVADIVKSHKGSLVYSGGDDVLSFVPLHTVLACARCLAETFRRQLADFKVMEDGKEISPTLSVGVAVAHHLEPLSDVLELARAAEKAAKSVPGKNALAVTLSKRSGAERTVKGAWGTLDQQLKTLDQRLERFIVLHRTEAIPDGAAYELRDLVRRLETSNDKLKDTLQKAAREETKRILRRKKARRGTEPIAENVLRELEIFLHEGEFFFEKLKQLADELIIAREFAAAMDLANIPLPAAPTGEVAEK